MITCTTDDGTQVQLRPVLNLEGLFFALVVLTVVVLVAPIVSSFLGLDGNK